MTLISSFKRMIASGLYHLKFFDLIKTMQKNRVIILMYHRFSSEREPFKIQQRVFENQIKFLKKKYNFISLRHYSEVLNGQRDDLPHNPIIITIDDGYWDNYTIAYPILKKYCIPATIFLPSDFVSNKEWLWANKLEYILKNSKRSEFNFSFLGDETASFRVNTFQEWHSTQLAIHKYCRMQSDLKRKKILHKLSQHLRVIVPQQTEGDFWPLSWKQVAEMDQDVIDFGSHTKTHRIMSRLSSQDLEHEIVQSKKEIESHLGHEINCFCYPGGGQEDFDNRAIEILVNTGYLCAVTTIPGFNNNILADKYILRRIPITSDYKPFLFRELTRNL